MTKAFFLSGLLIIIVGILIGKFKYYNLIAGYNTMPLSKKKKINIHAYGKAFLKVFLIMGFIIIIDSFAIFLFGESGIHAAIFIFTVLSGVIYLIAISKKYTINENDNITIHDKPNKKVVLLIIVISLLASFLLIFIGLKEPTIQFSSETIKLNSIYGFELKYKEITHLDTTSNLPNLTYRLNGFAFLNSYKGYFKTKENSICKLLVKTGNPPYIYIETSDKKKIYLNFKDKNTTLKIFNQIKEKL